VRVRLCALAAVLVLAGCTTAMPGVPEVGEELPLTSSVLGEPTTIDPCSLTGSAAFEEIGTARMPGTPTFDECRVAVAVDGGHAHVWVGLLRDDPLTPDWRDRVASPGRGTTIGRLADTCDTVLVLADGVSVTATAEPVPGSRPGEDTLCLLTEAALRGAYEVLAAGRVRHWAPPVSSLAVVYACDVVHDRDIEAALGLDEAAESPYPAEHRCRWGDPDGDPPSAEVRFLVGVSPSAVDVPDGARSETLAGRTSWVVPGHDPELASCRIVTEHGDFGLGTGTREFAVLETATGIARRGEDRCAPARTLAAKAWAGLPPLA
jgi:hypothetical protein